MLSFEPEKRHFEESSFTMTFMRMMKICAFLITNLRHFYFNLL